MVPTLKELKILLDATVILLMPCLKKIKHIGCLVENVLTKQILYQAYLKRVMGRSMSLIPIPCYCTRCVRKAFQDPPRFTDFCPVLQMACLPTQQWKNLFFNFQSMMYSHHSSNRQSTIILLIAEKKQQQKTTSLCAFPLLTHSLWIVPSIQPRVRKLGRSLD